MHSLERVLFFSKQICPSFGCTCILEISSRKYIYLAKNDEITKVTELLGRAILGKKMSQRKKSRTNFRYFVF